MNLPPEILYLPSTSQLKYSSYFLYRYQIGSNWRWYFFIDTIVLHKNKKTSSSSKKNVIMPPLSGIWQHFFCFSKNRTKERETALSLQSSTTFVDTVITHLTVSLKCTKDCNVHYIIAITQLTLRVVNFILTLKKLSLP